MPHEYENSPPPPFLGGEEVRHETEIFFFPLVFYLFCLFNFILLNQWFFIFLDVWNPKKPEAAGLVMQIHCRE